MTIAPLVTIGLMKAIMEKYKILNETDLDSISPFQDNRGKTIFFFVKALVYMEKSTAV